MAAENSLLELNLLKSLKPSVGNKNQNFSAQEIVIITQRFEENQAVLKSKFTKTTTKKMK